MSKGMEAHTAATPADVRTGEGEGREGKET